MRKMPKRLDKWPLPQRPLRVLARVLYAEPVELLPVKSRSPGDIDELASRGGLERSL